MTALAVFRIGYQEGLSGTVGEFNLPAAHVESYQRGYRCGEADRQAGVLETLSLADDEPEYNFPPRGGLNYNTYYLIDRYHASTDADERRKLAGMLRERGYRWDVCVERWLPEAAFRHHLGSLPEW